MKTVINGYIRRLKSDKGTNTNRIIPLEIIEICKKYYGDLTTFNLLNQTILYDLTEQTTNFYKIVSLKWIKLGIKKYFIDLEV